MNTLLADPVEMIANGAPRVIHNDRELETYSEALFQLTSLKRPNRAQREAIELLTLLVERYEAERYVIPPGEPIAVVRLFDARPGIEATRPDSSAGERTNPVPFVQAR